MKTVGSSRSGAIFSDCMKFRYRLWRNWDPKLPRVLFILLNPSTADDIHNDATIERQQRRVMLWNGQSDLFKGQLSSTKFGSIEVVNGCAYRSTDPAALYEIEDPIGEENGGQIHDAAKLTIDGGGIIICGWGEHLNKLYSGKYSLHQLLVESLERLPLSAFKLNSDGTPAHPLYLSYDLKPKRWFEDALHEDVL